MSNLRWVIGVVAESAFYGTRDSRRPEEVRAFRRGDQDSSMSVAFAIIHSSSNTVFTLRLSDQQSEFLPFIYFDFP